MCERGGYPLATINAMFRVALIMSYAHHVNELIGLSGCDSPENVQNFASTHTFQLQEAPTMESVRTVVLGKPVFLLTGAKPRTSKERNVAVTLDVEAPEKLIETARRNPDAVAFGFVAGSWVAAA